MFYIINRSKRVLNFNILGQSIQVLPNSYHKFAESFRLQEIVHAVKNFKNSLEEFPFLVDVKRDGSIDIYEFDPDKSLEKIAIIMLGLGKKEETQPEAVQPEVVSSEEENQTEETTDGDEGLGDEARQLDFPELTVDNVSEFLEDLTLDAKINSLKVQLKDKVESDDVDEQLKLDLVKKIADELCIPYSNKAKHNSIYKKILEQI